jgi:murein DD-endopeptidase MepM/ murein hydrolase activator NlpD
MGERIIARRGLARAVVAVALTGVIAGCAGDQAGPAPVYLKNGMAEGAPLSAPAPRRETQRVVVRPGQSLKGIARTYRVPERTIIAANHLTPPYKLKIGASLVIPGAAAEAPTQQAAAVPPRAVQQAPLPVPAAAPPVTVVPAPLAAAPAPAPPPAFVAAAPPPPAPVAAARTPPPIRDIISLDDPPPAPRAIAFPDPPASSSAPSTPAQAPPPGPSAAAQPRGEEGRQPTAMHGGRFSWPVRGRVLAAYGTTAAGAHNDGLNIAAPKGTPVAAIDGGTVAYAGNELRGYGNLVLIKHSNGLISAYAHCEELLVKRGDSVNRGQVIARVGATGGVSEPQLHFELRRGKKPIDPREFLAPAPSAGTAAVPAG